MLPLTPPASVICDSIIVHYFYFFCFGGMPLPLPFGMPTVVCHCVLGGGATSPEHVHLTDLNL